LTISKAKNHIETYKIKSFAKDFHEMSGRNDNRLTAFRNQKIISSMLLSKEDVIIDIGCGDGTLLSEISTCISRGFGIVPTNEEKLRLEKEHQLANIQFLQGLSTSLKCENEKATKVICNGVLLLLETKEELIESMHEIKRVAAKNALVWIGEIPRIDEFEYNRKSYGDSILRWILWVYKNNGALSAFNAIKKVIKAALTKESFVISPKKIFYIEPEDFIAICENVGFEVVTSFKSQSIDSGQNEIDSPTRYDYILRKL